MADKTWKRWERVVARFFGTERNRCSGSSGRIFESQSDSMHPDLYIETKFGNIARILNVEGREALRHAGEQSALEGKTPVLAIHPKGASGFWMLLHSADFDRLAASRADALAAEQHKGDHQCL